MFFVEPLYTVRIARIISRANGYDIATKQYRIFLEGYWVKAIIMAGGEGSRLRPLTCDCPKPMVRFLDKPILEYALLHLKAHGVKEVGVTLGYLPDRIKDAFGDGESLGLSLRYYTERQPLGTAGGVKQAQDMLTETFCVLSGDGITDIDLSRPCAVLLRHRYLLRNRGGHRCTEGPQARRC